MVEFNEWPYRQTLKDLRELHLELGDWQIPFHSDEWDGMSRQEAYESIHRELLKAIDDCKAHGIDVLPILYPDLT